MYRYPGRVARRVARSSRTACLEAECYPSSRGSLVEEAGSGSDLVTAVHGGELSLGGDAWRPRGGRIKELVGVNNLRFLSGSAHHQMSFWKLMNYIPIFQTSSLVIA